MADVDANISQQKLKDTLDKTLHQARGTLALMASHPELNQLDNALLCDALWGLEDRIKEVHACLQLLQLEQ